METDRTDYTTSLALSRVLRSNFSSNEDRVSALVNAFCDSLAESSRFSWLGLFEARDRLQRPRLILYLEQVPEVQHSGNRAHADIMPIFSELALAVRPKVFLDLYYRRPNGHSPADDRIGRCLEDIRVRYGSADASLVHDATLIACL